MQSNRGNLNVASRERAVPTGEHNDTLHLDRLRQEAIDAIPADQDFRSRASGFGQEALEAASAMMTSEVNVDTAELQPTDYEKLVSLGRHLVELRDNKSKAA